MQPRLPKQQRRQVWKRQHRLPKRPANRRLRQQEAETPKSDTDDSASSTEHVEAPDEEDLPGANEPASFINFLMSLATNAAAALGMMPHPATGESGVDLELAKHWVDVLGMLRKKRAAIWSPKKIRCSKASSLIYACSMFR